MTQKLQVGDKKFSILLEADEIAFKIKFKLSSKLSSLYECVFSKYRSNLTDDHLQQYCLRTAN